MDKNEMKRFRKVYDIFKEHDLHIIHVVGTYIVKDKNSFSGNKENKFYSLQQVIDYYYPITMDERLLSI